MILLDTFFRDLILFVESSDNLILSGIHDFMDTTFSFVSSFDTFLGYF